MSLATSALLTVVIVSAADSLLAQAPPSQFEHVKGLEPFMGTWEGKYQPPIGPKGTLRVTCQWTANRSYARLTWTFTPEGATTAFDPFSIHVGYSGKTKANHFWVMTWDTQASGAAQCVFC